jgi:GNAT superfamily N-acetyltransferase
MPDPEIRDAVPEDARRIAEVHVSSWRVAYAGLLPDEALTALEVDDFHEWRQRALSDRRIPGSATLVIEEGGALRGFADIGPAREMPEPEPRGEVYAIYLAPDAWGRGLGRALLEASERRLLKEGFSDAVLWVLESNQPTRRFYEACGWSSDGERKFAEVHGIQVMEARYSRTLAGEG